MAALECARSKVEFVASAFEGPIELSGSEQSGLCFILEDVTSELRGVESILDDARSNELGSAQNGWKGTLTPDVRGVELFDLLGEQWGLTVTDSMRIGEAAEAARAMGVTIDDFFEGMRAADLKRGTSGRENVMAHGFVPQENVERVRGLLGEVQALCLDM